jgi:ATP-dependent Zn protease
VKALVAEAHATAKAILERRRGDLDRLAVTLLERETIGAEDLGAEDLGPEDLKPEDLPRPGAAR